MQVHKEAEGHLVGFPHSLHLQAIRNLPTGFTLPVIYYTRKSSLQARGEMLKFLWRRFVRARFSLEFSGCPVTWWADTMCQAEVTFPMLWLRSVTEQCIFRWAPRSLNYLHFMRMQGTDYDSGCESCAFDLLKIQSLLWDGARGAVTNLISVRKITLTDFQWQWVWRHFEGYLHKKKRTGNLHWKKKVWLATYFLTWLMAEWLQHIISPFSDGIEQHSFVHWSQ